MSFAFLSEYLGIEVFKKNSDLFSESPTLTLEKFIISSKKFIHAGGHLKLSKKNSQFGEVTFLVENSELKSRMWEQDSMKSLKKCCFGLSIRFFAVCDVGESVLS